MAKIFRFRHRGDFCWIIGIILSPLLVEASKQQLTETHRNQTATPTKLLEHFDTRKEVEGKSRENRGRDAETNECEEDIEHQLIRKLLKGYDKHVRPVKNKKESIKVDFDMAYTQLVDLDGRRQILTSKVWIRQFWRNAFLTWNETEYCGITSIQLDPKMIWKPDIVLYNSIGISAGGEMYKFETMINLHSDGRNEWFAPTEIKSICHIDIAYFPFDYQNCDLKFGSWTHPSSTLNFTMKKPGSADLTMYYINGEWELRGVPAERNVIKYSCCEDPFIDITYKILLKRRVLFYLNNLVMPNLVLAGLVICSFYVPPESGERISLNITIMLGLTVFLLLFNERIPPSSEVVPLIGSYYFALFYQVGISMILTCVTSRCYHHNTFREMPRWFRVLIFRVLVPIFRMENKLQGQEENIKAWQPMEIKNKKPQRLLLYRTATGTIKLKQDLDTESTRSHNSCVHNLEARIEDISRQLGIFVDHLQRSEHLDSKKDEWRFASIVLDKLFFWFFLLSICVTTLWFYIKIETQTPSTQVQH